MVTASVLAVAWGARDRGKPKAPPRVAHVPETPWLSKEAAAQIVGPDGELGPLFANVMLGGLAPSAEEQARIEGFARTNHATIDLEIVEDQLVAIRFDVTYGGCCGYEGAEVLALRAHRPTVGGGCMGGPKLWVTDWTTENDGTYLRANVDINRVTFRWERTLTADELLDRADETLGVDTAQLQRSANDRWRSVANGRYLLEVPYPQQRWDVPRAEELGLAIGADRGRVTELGVTVRSTEQRTAEDALKAKWGRPSVRGSTWTWHKRDRVIEAEVDEGVGARVTLRRRSV